MDIPPLWIGAGAAGVVLLVLVLWLARRGRRSSQSFSYQSQSALSPQQMQCYQYLHAAFPEGAVLARVKLERLLSPRQTHDRDAARRALRGMRVDFAVCAENGKPIFAFDFAPQGNRTDAAYASAEREKNRVLKSAGVRLIRLKGAPANWPEPSEFRLKLALAALRPIAPGGEGAAEEMPLFRGPASRPATQSPESSIMGMSVLMELDEEAEAAWRSARD